MVEFRIPEAAARWGRNSAGWAFGRQGCMPVVIRMGRQQSVNGWLGQASLARWEGEMGKKSIPLCRKRSFFGIGGPHVKYE